MSPEAPPAGTGLLVAVVGPSGAGKDTLIRLALERFRDGTRIGLARRVITRRPDGTSEDHDSLDEADFAAAEAAGAFCLTWRAHGLAYGVPRGVEDEVRGGHLVVANLSRRSLDTAARRFPRLAVVEITAPRERLVERIAARGRESAAEIERRLARRGDLVVPPEALQFVTIDNAGSVEIGADALHRFLRRMCEDIERGPSTRADPTRS